MGLGSWMDQESWMDLVRAERALKCALDFPAQNNAERVQQAKRPAPRACTPHSSGQRVCRAVRVACIAAQCGAAGSNTCTKIHMLITIIIHAWQ